jgi:hypothetical protein
MPHRRTSRAPRSTKTKLRPATHFEYTPYGGATQRCSTLAEAAEAAAARGACVLVSGEVMAVTGRRRRHLTAKELRAVSHHLRRALRRRQEIAR